MTEPPPYIGIRIETKEYYPQVILILAFLGGIMFASLTFILQTSNFYDQVARPSFAEYIRPVSVSAYVGGLEATLGSLALLSAVGCLASSRMLSHTIANPAFKRRMLLFVDGILILVIAGFGISVFLLLLPYSIGGATLVIVIFLVVWGWFAIEFVRTWQTRKREYDKIVPIGSY